TFAVFNELSVNHVAMARRRGTLWLDDVRFYTEVVHKDDALPQTSDLPQLVAGVLADHGLAGRRVGVDAGGDFLAEAGVALVPLVQELRGLRLVLTHEELELARRAAGLTDWAQELYRAEIRPGRMVDELDWSIGARILEEAGNRWPGESVKVR